MFHSPVELLHFTCGLHAFGFLFFVASAGIDRLGVDRLGVDRLDTILTGVTGGTVDILLEFCFEVCLNFCPCKWSIVHTSQWTNLKAFKKYLACLQIHISKHSFLWCEAYQLFFPSGAKHTKFCFLYACKYTLLFIFFYFDNATLNYCTACTYKYISSFNATLQQSYCTVL